MSDLFSRLAGRAMRKDEPARSEIKTPDTLVEENRDLVTQPELHPQPVPQAPHVDVVPAQISAKKRVAPTHAGPDPAIDAVQTSEASHSASPASATPAESGQEPGPQAPTVETDRSPAAEVERPTSFDPPNEMPPSPNLPPPSARTAPVPANPTVARPIPVAPIWPAPLAPRRPEPAAVDDPPIRVHIGRLDVRANLETPIEKTKMPVAKGVEPEPELTLSGYLRGERTTR